MLAPLARELNAASDLFTKELKAIEAELGSYGLGVDVTLFDATLAVWPPIVSELDGRLEDVTSRLAYGRSRDGWRLLVRTYRARRDADADRGGPARSPHLEEPLLGASRELRIAAADQIEALLGRMADAARERIASLNTAIDDGPLPEGWKQLRLAIDEQRVVHVLKRDRSGDALCGAKPISTNFPHEDIRACGQCRVLAQMLAR